MRGIAIVCIALTLSSCVRRTGRNTNCYWPGESPLSNPTERHLSADAEFAEDLAVRYADTHFGPRTRQFESMAGYRQGIQRCAYTLYEAVAATHHVPVSSVQNALGKNRTFVDIGEFSTFLFLYALASVIAIRRIRSLCSAGDGWAHSLALTLFCAIAFALAGVLSFDEWVGTVESLRVGTWHMSYRGFRLPGSHHRNFIFSALLVFFWITVFVSARIAAHSNLPVLCNTRAAPPSIESENESPHRDEGR